MARRARKQEAEVGVKECKTPGCTNLGDCSRGNCNGCYKRYNREVNAGLTTWKKLIREGKTNEKYPPRSPASKALAAR